MSSGSIRIIQLPEKSSVNTDDYMAVDSSANGTKKVKFTDLLDDNLSAQNKAADAQATGEAIGELNTDINNANARIDNLIINGEPSVETLWTGTLQFGTATTATLSKAVSNYDFLDFYTDNGEAHRVSVSSGSIQIKSVNTSDDGSIAFFDIGEAVYNFSGTTVTLTRAVEYRNDQGTVTITANANIYGDILKRVDGVKMNSVALSEEVSDIRVGDDGVTYSTAGEAVRTQFADVKSALNAVADIEYRVSDNLWDISRNIDGYQLDSSGNPVENSNYTLTDFIEVEASTQYWAGIIYNGVYAPSVQRVCFYNSSKTYLDKTSTTADVGTFTTVANTKYIRMAVNTPSFFGGGNDTAMLLKGNAPTGYVPYFAPYNFAEVKDSALNYEEVNEHINANERVYLFASLNLFDVNNTDLILNGKALDSSGNVSNNSSLSVIKIPVNGIDSKKYYLYGLNTNGTGYIPKQTRIAMYDAHGINLGILINNTTNPAIITNNNCKYLYMYYDTSKLDKAMVLTDTNGASISSSLFIPYEKKYLLKTQWFNKGWSAYGDSITAISNGNSLTSGWAYYVNKIHGFSKFYGRGIGGQQFAWRTNGGSVAFINADGTYNSRNDSYNYDNYTGEIPSGCTAVRGAFSSWLRIKTMFPASIKDDINLVFVMGGTNGAYDDTALEWVADDTTDPEWAVSEEYATYGGDYNISTFNGGVASTIMKMQAWMPNALIVLGTPLNGQTNDAGHIKPNTIPDEYQKSKLVEEIGKMFGCPVVDVFGRCGINVLNSPTYITDGTHPYNSAGAMMLGRTVASGFGAIEPKM